jgi:hypothetical protein
MTPEKKGIGLSRKKKATAREAGRGRTNNE